MTDAEYLFKETEKDRKRTGYGAKHKKRGGGRYVRTPSDYKTRKEREAMNGEVKVFKEKPFYTWEEFKELPDDIKLKWVNSLMNRYNVGVRTISQRVFGKSESALYLYMKNRNLAEYLNTKVGGNPAVKNKCAEALAKDLYEYMKEEPTNEATVAEEPVNEACEEEKPPVIVADTSNIATILAMLAGTGAKITIELTL